MKRILSPLLLAFILVGMSACTPTETDDTLDDGATSSMTETRNVLYQGIVRAGGGSIREATHRLIVSEERLIGLQSDSVALNDYVAAEVEVLGAVRLAANDRDMIMRVESITRLDEDSSSSSSSDALSSSSTSDESASSLSTLSSLPEEVASVASSFSSANAESSMVSQDARSSVQAASTATATSTPTNISDAKVRTMAEAKLGADQWTQQYCSSHIGFCIPVHRNWWYTSFGTTSSALWHVEVGPEQITNLGDGPLTVNLVSGSIASTGQSDSAVQVTGDAVIGYRAWDDTRHIEIRAPAALEPAVDYITQALQRTEN